MVNILKNILLLPDLIQAMQSDLIKEALDLESMKMKPVVETITALPNNTPQMYATKVDPYTGFPLEQNYDMEIESDDSTIKSQGNYYDCPDATAGHSPSDGGRGGPSGSGLDENGNGGAVRAVLRDDATAHRPAGR